MKTQGIVSAIIVSAVLVVACGSDDGPVVLKPELVPEEYQGMSLEELRVASKALSYGNILGMDKDKYAGGNDSMIEDNIMQHKGRLFSDKGVVEEIYPSSQLGVFTLWVCSLKGVVIDSTFSSHLKTGDNCVDPLFLLYDLDRGPVLKKDDIINFSAVVSGIRKKSGTQIRAGGQGAGARSARTIVIVPSMSVIKAEIIQE